MADTRELYYAHMEADRNESETAYFGARPQADTLANRALFRAGYERAYDKLWPLAGAPGISDETGDGHG